MNKPSGVLVAVDGGGSKTDAVALDANGRVLGRAHGPASSPQNIGVAPAAAVVDSLVREVLSIAGRPLSAVGIYLSGLDLPVEIETFRTEISAFAWAREGEREPIIDNDMFALLRSGTKEANAVAVVCGTGINCVGVRADGAHARFAALGTLSGDWGGGSQLGEQALWHAARAVDGRGAATEFTSTIPQRLGLADVAAVIEAVHFGQLPRSVFASLAPLVLEASDRGDFAARAIVERQASEIADIAIAALSRLSLLDRAIPIVLGGGILAAGNTILLSRIAELLTVRAPLARIRLASSRPILGAALLILESVDAAPSSLTTAREEIVAQIPNTALAMRK